MLALQKLIAGSKIDNTLNGVLFTQNNNRAYAQLEDVYSTVVLGANGDKEVYCSLVTTSKKFESCYVNVERAKSEEADCGSKAQHTLLKVSDIRPSLPDLSGLPQYFTAFAEPLGRPLLQCIVDHLVGECFGTRGVELCRNLTVDLYDSESGCQEHSDVLWRDFSGFVVADRFRYCEVNIKCESLLNALSSSSLPPNVSIHAFSPTTRSLFHDYDQTVSVMGRTEYLDFLLDLNGLDGVVAIDDRREPLGYALALPGRILQCYAEDERLATSLLHALLSSSQFTPDSSISMFLRMSTDHSMDASILPAADQIRRVRRFHSRIVPTSVKWTKVFVPNIGAHLY